MDKRFNTLSNSEQLELRRKAIEDVLAHPEWSLPQAVRHLKRTMRLTTAEMAKLSGIGFRTMQDIEQERSEGSVQTMNRIFGMLGLKLGVARIARDAGAPGVAAARHDDET
jgi:transcriptional regulator with XRE-family HTH domain